MLQSEESKSMNVLFNKHKPAIQFRYRSTLKKRSTIYRLPNKTSVSGSNPVTFPPEHPEVVDLCLTEDVEVEADPDEGEEAAQGPQHQGVQLQAPPR